MLGCYLIISWSGDNSETVLDFAYYFLIFN